MFWESKMSEHVHEVTDQSFENEVLKSEVPVLVDFWAEWCTPCKALAPTVEAVAKEYGSAVKVVKLNIDESNQVPMKYGIKGIPTLLLFKGGNEVDRSVGNQPKERIKLMLDRTIGAAAAENKAS
jgi:thioredoxin 1